MTRDASEQRMQLIEQHLPLVRALARRYVDRGESLEDLVQVGSVGLVKAADRYEPGRGVPFPAFAAPTIVGELKRHLRDRPWPVRVPRTVQELATKARHEQADLAAQGRAPSVEELARALGEPPDEVWRALRLPELRAALPLGEGEEALERAGGEDAHADGERRALLAGGWRVLDERQRHVVYLRFHADLSEEQIAREIGVSQAHVSRILRDALERLRSELSGDASTQNAAISPVPEAGAALPEPPRPLRIAPMPAPQPSPEPSPAQRYRELPYHISVAQSDDKARGRTWIASVEELPGCWAAGRSPDDAVARLSTAMERWITDALGRGKQIPRPRSEPSHSGRFLLRMPASLHGELARAADRDEISLNQFITGVLAGAVGWRQEGAAPNARRPANPPAAEPATAASAGARATSAPAPGPAPAAVAAARAPAERPEPARPAGRGFVSVALAANFAVVLVAGLVALALLVLALNRGL